MLKKQTVWLLTMLSLLVVLSVFYITSDNENDLALINQDRTSESQTANQPNDVNENSEVEVDNIANVQSDELFTTIRLELQDDRSMEKSRLEAIVASGTASIEEKDSALQGIDLIESIETSESILEQTILSLADYEDVLVRNSNGEKVHVQVRTDELSKEEALQIMQLVRDEFDRDIPVDVNY
ncbi:SpoIIIAH-like family protein [Oceanobacillus sp. CAU 1775]